MELGRGVGLDRRPVGAFYRSQAGGEQGFAGGDGLPVAPAVGVFVQSLTVQLDFADVGLAVAGMGR